MHRPREPGRLLGELRIDCGAAHHVVVGPHAQQGRRPRARAIFAVGPGKDGDGARGIATGRWRECWLQHALVQDKSLQPRRTRT